MARYDKYDPISGGFRAPLAATWAGPLATPVGVGLDANGRVVAGPGTSGIVAVVVIDGSISPAGVRTNTKFAGDVVDCMTDGEIVDCTGLVAGTSYYATAAGVVNSTNTGTRVGHTVEAQRLVVRAAR